MDRSRFDFDSWTRRRIGLAVGGIAAALAGLFSADAKKKKKRRKNKKKKRRKCKKLRESCVDGGRRCCHGRTCGGDPVNGTFC